MMKDIKQDQTDVNAMAIKRIEEIIKKREEISGAEFDKGYNLIKTPESIKDIIHSENLSWIKNLD